MSFDEGYDATNISQLKPSQCIRVCHWSKRGSSNFIPGDMKTKEGESSNHFKYVVLSPVICMLPDEITQSCVDLYLISSWQCVMKN